MTSYSDEQGVAIAAGPTATGVAAARLQAETDTPTVVDGRCEDREPWAPTGKGPPSSPGGTGLERVFEDPRSDRGPDEILHKILGPMRQLSVCSPF